MRESISDANSDSSPRATEQRGNHPEETEEVHHDFSFSAAEIQQSSLEEKLKALKQSIVDIAEAADTHTTDSQRSFVNE